MIGGMSGITNRFMYDSGKAPSNSYYYPSTSVLNTVLKAWAKESIVLYGIIHSHPNNMAELSYDDIRFARAILQKNPQMNAIYFPIVLTEVDSAAFQIIPYLIDRTVVKYSCLQITN